MKRVAVTGASGFVAQYLIRQLLTDGVSVLALGRSEESLAVLPASVARLVTPYGEDLVRGLDGVDTIFHLAGKRTERSDNPLTIAPFTNDALRLIDALLLAANANQVERVVQTSSIAVYSAANQAPYREVEKAVPASPYGLSKLFSEQACEFWSQRTGIPVASARIAQCYGFGEKLTPALMSISDRASRGQQLTVKDGGHYKIDEIYVQDVVDALILMARSNAHGEFNVGSGLGYSVREIAEAANAVYGNTSELIVEPVGPEARSSAPRHMDISKAEQIIGWRPKFDLQTGLNAMKLESEHANSGSLKL